MLPAQRPPFQAAVVVTGHYILGLPLKALRGYSLFSMATYKTTYQCRECGATSYQPVMDRAENGSIQATGQYRCSGCRNIFATIRAWWEPRRRPDFQASSLSG